MARIGRFDAAFPKLLWSIVFVYCTVHRVRKKVDTWIYLHNYGERRRILTNFCTNNATSNKWPNLSKVCHRLREVTASLATSTEKCRHVIDKAQNSNMFKVCIQNILHVVKCKLVDVNVTAWVDHQTEVFPLFDQTLLQLGDVMNLAAVHTLLQLPRDPVVSWADVRTVGWPESWSDKVWCLTG